MGRGQRCLTTIQPFWGICCFECFDPLLHHGRISNQITLGQLPLNGWGSVSPSRRTSSKSPLSTMNKGNCCNSGWFRKRFSGHTQILLHYLQMTSRIALTQIQLYGTIMYPKHLPAPSVSIHPKFPNISKSP